MYHNYAHCGALNPMLVPEWTPQNSANCVTAHLESSPTPTYYQPRFTAVDPATAVMLSAQAMGVTQYHHPATWMANPSVISSGAPVLPVAMMTPSPYQATLLRIHQTPYRAKMLPPPLQLEEYNLMWHKNEFEEEEDHEKGGENGSNCSLSTEDSEDRHVRLEGYRVLMERWFHVVQMLASKLEVRSRMPSSRRPCPSLEETQIRLQREGNYSYEEALRCWSRDSYRWWEDSFNKPSRKMKKRESRKGDVATGEDDDVTPAPPSKENCGAVSGYDAIQQMLGLDDGDEQREEHHLQLSRIVADFFQDDCDPS